MVYINIHSNQEKRPFRSSQSILVGWSEKPSKYRSAVLRKKNKKYSMYLDSFKFSFKWFFNNLSKARINPSLLNPRKKYHFIPLYHLRHSMGFYVFLSWFRFSINWTVLEIMHQNNPDEFSETASDRLKLTRRKSHPYHRANCISRMLFWLVQNTLSWKNISSQMS